MSPIQAICKTVPTLSNICNCKPCICEECTRFSKNCNSNNDKLRILYENTMPKELPLDHAQFRNNICKVSTHNYSNHRYKPMTCVPCQSTESTRTLTEEQSCEILENNSHINQEKNLNVYNSIHDELFYLCQYKNKILLTDNLKDQELNCTGGTLCKCAPCECLSCAFLEKTSLIESEDSSIVQYIKDEWKRMLRMDRNETHDRNIKYRCRLHGNLTKNIIGNIGELRCLDNCSKFKTCAEAQANLCHCSEINKNCIYLKDKPTKMVNNVYIPEISIEENNKKIQNDHFQDNGGLCKVGNEMGTNTECITSEKNSQTNKCEPPKENKNKKYEYTLKIEIATPNVEKPNMHDTKQMIKKVYKNKILEQTESVINDIINDISMSYPEEQPEEFSVKDQNKLKSVKISPVDQNPSISSRSSIRNQDTKIVSSALIAALPIVPESTSITESELARNLDKFKVQEPCAKRVSNNTVSLRWELPKAVTEIMGYEILVDGKTVEKILNANRCMAIVTCLPPVHHLLITIRSITKSPERGLLPCTTMGYWPRTNKYIRI